MPVYATGDNAWLTGDESPPNNFDARRHAASWFLATLYGESTPGYLVLCGSSPVVGGFGPRLVVPADSLSLACEAVAHSEEDTWFAVCTRGVHPGVGRVGDASLAMGFPGVWADLDFRTDDGAHKGQKALWPESAEDALSIVESLGPDLQPSIVVHSGHGLQPYWLLDTPYILDKEDPEEYEGPYNGLKHEFAEALVRRMHAALSEASRAKGWAAPDNVANLARVMRVPGSYNRKVEDHHKTVRLFRPPSMKRYTVEQLDALLPRRGSDTGSASGGFGVAAGAGGQSSQGGQRFSTAVADIEEIKAGCAWMRHIEEDAVGLDYPQWVAGLTILTRCKDGGRLVHEWSEADPRYSVAGTDAKAAEAFNNMGPRTCAWVEQETDGVYCHSCPHWGKIKSPVVLGNTTPSSPTRGGPDRPVYNVEEQDLKTALPVLWAGLQRVNDDNLLFRQGTGLVHVKQGTAGNYVVAQATKGAIDIMLANAFLFMRTLKAGPVESTPPPWAAESVLNDPKPKVPVLTRLVEAPVLGPDGDLRLEWGYHPSTESFYAPAVGLQVPEVSEAPKAEEVREAKRLLLEELLVDFPFVSDAERAHAIAAMLLPFVRDLIPGQTPLHMLEKPAAGTGASLLVGAICMPALGEVPPMQTQPHNEDEWRKLITTQLGGARTYFVLDNVTNLRSQALAAALTMPTWTDRLLGTNIQAVWPVKCAWLATGNNPELSRELVRRVVRIRLDAHVADPEKRPSSSFRHPDLMEWAKEHRGRLVWACLTLCRHWYAQGQPRGQYNLASYEAWSRIMGGILDACEIPGFLGNRDEESLNAAVGEDEGDLEFIKAWWHSHGKNVLKTADLTPLALGYGLDLGRGDPTRGLGWHLRRSRDKVYDLPDNGGRVTLKKGRSGGLWYLEETVAAPAKVSAQLGEDSY